MTCYQRHLGWLFDSLGVPYDSDGRRRMHGAVVAQLGLAEDAHCPEVWAALKDRYAVDARTPSEDLASDIAARLR